MPIGLGLTAEQFNNLDWVKQSAAEPDPSYTLINPAEQHEFYPTTPQNMESDRSALIQTTQIDPQYYVISGGYNEWQSRSLPNNNWTYEEAAAANIAAGFYHSTQSEGEEQAESFWDALRNPSDWDVVKDPGEALFGTDENVVTSMPPLIGLPGGGSTSTLIKWGIGIAAGVGAADLGYNIAQGEGFQGTILGQALSEPMTLILLLILMSRSDRNGY